jgi:2-oxoglutarate ferredoxin oxidoreductase subunit gamma
VRAQLVISPHYVDSPVVEAADVFVAFSAPAYKRFFELCRGKVLYDPELVEQIRPDYPERHVAVPATALAKERLNNVLFANMVMLGALTRLADMDYAAMRETMLGVIPRFHEQNLAALDLGYNLPAVAHPALS